MRLKLISFFLQSELQQLHTNTITNFQKTIRPILNRNESFLSDSNKWEFINLSTSQPLNLSPPTFRGFIKVYEPYAAIRPVVNYRNAPGYKVAKFFNKQFRVTHSNLRLFF